jgi:hypothetical protein
MYMLFIIGLCVAEPIPYFIKKKGKKDRKKERKKERKAISLS